MWPDTPNEVKRYHPAVPANLADSFRAVLSRQRGCFVDLVNRYLHRYSPHRFLCSIRPNGPIPKNIVLEPKPFHSHNAMPSTHNSDESIHRHSESHGCHLLIFRNKKRMKICCRSMVQSNWIQFHFHLRFWYSNMAILWSINDFLSLIKCEFELATEFLTMDIDRCRWHFRQIYDSRLHWHRMHPVVGSRSQLIHLRPYMASLLLEALALVHSMDNTPVLFKKQIPIGCESQ